MSNSQITKHYTRLLTLWPKDKLRPTLPFQRLLEHRSAIYAPPPASTSNASQPSTSTPTAPPPLPKPDAKVEMLNINAFYSLLENRYSKRYPISQRLLRPTTNEKYYDDLIEEIDRAPDRSWFRTKIETWKRMIRWK